MYLQNCPLVRGEEFAKIDAGSGRVVEQAAFEQRVSTLLETVPITRVADISRIERSPLPVFAATTPLARDLTTHMGKGSTLRAARISAIMEGIERVSAEMPHGQSLSATYAQLLKQRRNCVDPERFDLPPTTKYAPDLPFDWVAGWDLIGRCEILIPADLCVSPPQQGVLDQVDTNGLASGASFGEAIRHALLEVIERDASGQQLFFELFGSSGQRRPACKRIDRETLPEQCVDHIRSIETGRCRIVLEEITTDIGIPVVSCYLVDEAYPAATGPTRAIFGGWGCDTKPQLAVIRAITEAHQSRIGTIQSTRDSFNVVEDGDRPFSRDLRQSILEAAPEKPLSDAKMQSDSIADDVEMIIDHLRAVGVDQVVVVDLSQESLQIPVVRVRVPGLSVFMADRRRIGWRCMRHIL